MEVWLKGQTSICKSVLTCIDIVYKLYTATFTGKKK